jgi:hypothetical protein
MAKLKIKIYSMHLGYLNSCIGTYLEFVIG